MHHRIRAWLLSALTDPIDSAPDDPELRGRIRARQVAAIARLTPTVAFANILNALAVFWTFAVSGEALWQVGFWCAAVVAAAGWFWLNWARRRHRPFPQSMSEATTRRVVRNALLLALLWTYPAIFLVPGIDLLPQVLVLAVTAGMVTGGITCFYPIPQAAAAYALPLIVAAVWGTVHVSVQTTVAGVIVLGSYLMVVHQVVARHAAIFVSEIVARIELEAKTRHIEALLLRAEAETKRIASLSARRLEHAQKMEAVGQLSGGMAHDFNNILSVVRGNAELQRQTPGKDETLIDEIIAAAERGASLIQKLLAFARRQALKPEPLATDAVLEDVASVLRRLLSERITISLDLPEGLWLASADPAQLQAALVNIATNARDAMPEGGPLTVTAANRTLTPTMAIALRERQGHDIAPGDYVAIALRDGGSGMNADTAARAFEPFFTTKPVGQGTGLGLSMVLGFARQSEGFVTLEGMPGAGTTVTLYLPRATRSAVAGPVPPPKAVVRGYGESVLLVEDQSMVRRTLARMLDRLGYAVTEAASVAEAETLIAQGCRPKLVISDVVLPGGLSGFDLVERLANEDSAIAVLLMSGYPDIGAGGQGEVAIPVLRKPFTQEALAQAIRAHLDCIAVPLSRS